MKKVAFYIESMILGGAEKMLLEIVNHLDPADFDITIISIYKESVYSTAVSYDYTHLVNKNIHIVTLIDNSRQLTSNIYNHLYANVNKSLIYSFLIRDKYDIEVAFYEGLPTEFVAYSTNKKSIKFAWLHTDNDRLYRDKKPEELDYIYRVYRKFDRVIGVSHSVKESFLHYFSDVPCTVIYNGIDFSEIKKKANEICKIEKTKEITFITVGRIVPVKGYDRLLKACKRLLHEGFRFSLLMIGDGSERESLIDYIQKNKLNDSIKMLGKQDNPYKYFCLCDAFICSSVYEGFGLAIIEAMSCGLPILSTDFPCIREILGENNLNWNICENNEEGIYQLLKESLMNPQRLEELVSLSLNQSKRFGIKEQVQNIQELFMNGEM